ncbi:unnamed protein product [Caenorhabditis sp. 36 PRJEB53466]|nr:unnamed protein product [Caenorhabditis sp. 36 PRJEB53466]
MSVVINDDDHFKKVFEEKKGKPIILFFTATWCGPCKLMKPIVEEKAKENAGRFTVLLIDVDICEQAVEQYSIDSMPTFLLVINGEIKDSFSSYSPGKFAAMAEKALK